MKIWFKPEVVVKKKLLYILALYWWKYMYVPHSQVSVKKSTMTKSYRISLFFYRTKIVLVGICIKQYLILKLNVFQLNFVVGRKEQDTSKCFYQCLREWGEGGLSCLKDWERGVQKMYSSHRKW